MYVLFIATGDNEGEWKAKEITRARDEREDGKKRTVDVRVCYDVLELLISSRVAAPASGVRGARHEPAHITGAKLSSLQATTTSLTTTSP
ncbi:hypothetical protein KQX54_004490 [Cotesia glomerata]|uniref:Uncharacterized protein n=1 Tax=Cotesia glomerata TaxID=32391 RepID=A0AAV7J505_COTGL|nr:hypothetical protein KQX54_004490 [Cotesia glomerata]